MNAQQKEQFLNSANKVAQLSDIAQEKAGTATKANADAKTANDAYLTALAEHEKLIPTLKTA